MAEAAQITVFLGTLVGVLILFNAMPRQYNAKIAAYGLLHLLTVLILFVSLATRHFSNVAIGILALIAAAATLFAGSVVYRTPDPDAKPPFTTANLVLETLTIVLVFGAAGLGVYS